MCWRFFYKVKGWRLEMLFKKDFDADFFSCKRWKIFYLNNLGQNIVDKFSKLSKNKCFCEMSVFLLSSLFFIQTFDYHQNNKVADDTYQ